MTIRRTLLTFFLLMSLAPSTLLTVLAFFQARDALQAEIMRNLRDDASNLAEDVDRMLFERLQNVHTWSHLEIMQEIHVRDVDKRLSHFLNDLKTHYEGVYESLYCTDAAGQIIASSEPGRVGKATAPVTPWQTVALPDGEAFLEPLSLSEPGREASLSIGAPVHNTFAPGILGTLYVRFDWNEIFRLLDKLGTHQPGTAEKLALLFDPDGRIIAASSPLRRPDLLLSAKLAGWKPARDDNMIIAGRDDDLGLGEILVGSARSKGYQGFPGLGWSVLVIQPTALAFAPVVRMAWAFLLLLVVTSAAAVGVSLLITGRIARPIGQLTQLTRTFMQRQELPGHIKPGSGEVGELTDSFIRMIHDLEKSRANLIRAAKLAVVGEMAAIMAHEVRTPLGILRSSTQMLQREPSLTPVGREMLGFLLGETDRLNKLISALLESARPRPPTFRPCPLHGIIRRVLDLLTLQAQKKDVLLRTEFLTASDLLYCDEEQMIQVLLNLLLNPLQILPKGSEIVIRTISEGSSLIIEVDDNGPGIPEEHRQRVFDPFFTQREGGIGLGLTVVQQIVKAHGADITATRSATGGARFRIHFPERQLTES